MEQYEGGINMPKLALSPYEKRNNDFVGNIKKYLHLRGVEDNCQLAKRLGIDPSTLRRKLEDPGKFSLQQLREITTILRFSREDIDAII